MKAINPNDKWVNDGSSWGAYNHNTLKTVKGFVTEKACWDWIHENYPEDANGVTEHVTAEWFPANVIE
jgi:hypothetical protein